MPSHGAYSTLLQRDDVSHEKLMDLHEDRNRAVLVAHQSALCVQNALRVLGGDESRFVGALLYHYVRIEYFPLMAFLN